MGVVNCPNCGGKVSSSRNNCPHCNYVFKKITCPECKEECSDGLKECPTCGYVFVNVPNNVQNNANYNNQANAQNSQNNGYYNQNANNNPKPVNKTKANNGTPSPLLIKITNIVSCGILLLIAAYLLAGMFGNLFSVSIPFYSDANESQSIGWYFGTSFDQFDSKSYGYVILDELIYIFMVVFIVLFIVFAIMKFVKCFKETELVDIKPFALYFIPVYLHVFMVSMMIGQYMYYGFGTIFLVLATVFYLLDVIYSELMNEIQRIQKTVI